MRATISDTDVVRTHPKNMVALLPLTPPMFHILLALTDGERHGSAIMREVARAHEWFRSAGAGHALRLFEAHADSAAG